MGVVVCPTVTESDSLKRALCVLQPVGRTGIHDIFLWVIAGGIVAAILDEVHIMAESCQTHYVLQMMPSVTCQRPAYDIAEHDDAQAAGWLKLGAAHFSGSGSHAVLPL